jgi:hypothetical protein
MANGHNWSDIYDFTAKNEAQRNVNTEYFWFYKPIESFS